MSSIDRSARAVTLLEVLVSSVAIAVLAALVLPATAHNVGRQRMTVCSRNLGHIAQGVIQYATENDDWIVGAPSTSADYLRYEPMAYGPAVQIWDFLGPLDHMWNPDTPLPERGDIEAVKDRFNMLRSKPEYSCPQNHFQAPCYDGPDAGIGPMVSYNTCRYQLWNWHEALETSHGVTPPERWWPRISDMGSPQNKVFCADGSRFSTTSIPPDYTLTHRDTYGGAFADTGSFSRYSRSWDRGMAPGNGNPNGGDFDARFYAFRHGFTARNLNGDIIRAVFKMNLAFYDGHVELQDDLTSSDPHQWLPVGTELDTDANCSPDTIEHFGLEDEITIGD